jgi:catechol 2,3-dioxygenase-like lactoylglutathione lyase family enzyme
MASEFPVEGVEVSVLLVVEDLGRARDFYRDVLGATLHREYGGSTAVFRFQGTWLLLVTGGDPTEDKPGVTFVPPADPDRVSTELTIRVPDCRGAYDVLRSRGATFLTPPHDWGGEIRCFFRDPDGHLLEISEVVQTG